MCKRNFENCERKRKVGKNAQKSVKKYSIERCTKEIIDLWKNGIVVISYLIGLYSLAPTVFPVNK